MKIYRSAQASILTLALVGIASVVAMFPQIGWKLGMGYLSVGVALAGYALYIISMFKEETDTAKRIRPHPFSWSMFGFLTATGWLVQEAAGGEAGSWCLGVTAAACFVIAGTSYVKYRHEWYFTWDDWVALLFGAALFVFYVVTHNLVVSATLAAGADLALYWPTVKKGWQYPYTDNPVNFIFNSVKCIPALLALSVMTYSTSVYLWMLLVVNGLVAGMLIWRRQYVSAAA